MQGRQLILEDEIRNLKQEMEDRLAAQGKDTD